MRKIDIPSPYFVSTMEPVDSKNVVNKLEDLQNLGNDNFKAFSYYRGLIVYCHETKKRYEWTDQLSNDDDKLLDNDFTYPRGVIINDIDYSDLSFNFINYSSDSNFINEDNTLEINEGKINTNVGRNLQEMYINELSFPIQIKHEKEYSYIEDIHIAGVSIPRRFWRHYEGYLNILDFTSVIQLPVISRYDIELKGTYFYTR